jgi:hypothetical protein
MVEAVTVRRDRIPRPKLFVIKILTCKFFDIKILHAVFAEPAPSKAFRGTGGGGYPDFSASKGKFACFGNRVRKLYFSTKSTTQRGRL